MLKARILTLVLSGAVFPLASASIYPTQPIQTTVWSVEQPMLVTWVDDWQYPTLDVMGPCQISLYRDTDTYLIKLASGVDPQSKSQQVTVPADVLKDGSTYTLRFVTDTPLDTVVYSADFMIDSANTTHASTTSTVGTGAGSSGNSTSPARTSSTGPAPISSNRSSEPSTVVVPPSRPGNVGGQQPQGARQAKSNSAGRRFDVEKIKFRLVFVIWPVLMGITMAL
ncbi:hypothetical protein PAXRUDRAFT_355644 [Paxillus rubicundulus Ve08.2h10]|uniref:Yeast cell wall synthesis Kre9/Knh1-like N-terminal domain-containing protein n=1 Tax=Paxillus rubicundulus Ve08.2h10 TaxID=930991 RepID=A0A0D0E3Z8_9AGAM|nr:hypothetical protein PAXRUDRAFT_355644 [Paxillus rubicundulus Ve08.2h10]